MWCLHLLADPTMAVLSPTKTSAPESVRVILKFFHPRASATSQSSSRLVFGAKSCWFMSPPADSKYHSYVWLQGFLRKKVSVRSGERVLFLKHVRRISSKGPTKRD